MKFRKLFSEGLLIQTNQNNNNFWVQLYDLGVWKENTIIWHGVQVFVKVSNTTIPSPAPSLARKTWTKLSDLIDPVFFQY